VSQLLPLQCRCGAIQLEVRGAASAQFFCHCDDCQLLHGAAYVPESVYPADAVRVTSGTPFSWTLKRNPRVGCPSCGTRLFIDVLAARLRGVNGYLLPPSEFKPTFHMHCRFAVRPVVDDLPHYTSRPARFGGSDEIVDW
jgi:hypothetical protein